MNEARPFDATLAAEILIHLNAGKVVVMQATTITTKAPTHFVVLSRVSFGRRYVEVIREDVIANRKLRMRQHHGMVSIGRFKTVYATGADMLAIVSVHDSAREAFRLFRPLPEKAMVAA